MNQNNLNLVKGSLSRKRQAAVAAMKPVEPTQEEIDDLFEDRITAETNLPALQPLFDMFDVPCFYRGELVADCGKAKSGKTFFLSILMSACLTQKALALKRHAEGKTNTNDTNSTNNARSAEIKPLRVLWLDTEQSKQSTQEIIKNRIIPLAERELTGLADSAEDAGKRLGMIKAPETLDSVFYAFNLRGLGFEKRNQKVDLAIRLLKPDIVIIDGIKDLMTDINDAIQATLLMEKLMALAAETNCCIVCVLHLNKAEQDRNMRGSIGTELTNKAFEVFQCEVMEDAGIFKVTHTFSRKRKMKRKFYYRVDDDGLPCEVTDYQEQPRDEWGRWTSPKPKQAVIPDVKWESFNQDYILHDDANDTYEWDLRDLFEDAMEGRPSRPFKQFMGAALKLSHIQDPNYFYHLVEEGIAKKIISKKPHPDTKETYVILNEDTLFGGAAGEDSAPF